MTNKKIRQICNQQWFVCGNLIIKNLKRSRTGRASHPTYAFHNNEHSCVPCAPYLKKFEHNLKFNKSQIQIETQLTNCAIRNNSKFLIQTMAKNNFRNWYSPI
uniref:Uncharacterized protein n=1 Tax=Arundo donax TaxID=35708 RepID=A0A0A9BVB0_ARUDO